MCDPAALREHRRRPCTATDTTQPGVGTNLVKLKHLPGKAFNPLEAEFSLPIPTPRAFPCASN
jgi:hypothetical protein